MATSICASKDELERDCITAIVRVAAAKAGFQDLKPEQMQAILEFIDGRDIFVSLPTGYGKSLIHGLLPLSSSETQKYICRRLQYLTEVVVRHLSLRRYTIILTCTRISGVTPNRHL